MQCQYAQYQHQTAIKLTMNSFIFRVASGLYHAQMTHGGCWANRNLMKLNSFAVIYIFDLTITFATKAIKNSKIDLLNAYIDT